MRAVQVFHQGGPEVLTIGEQPTPRPAAGQVTIDVAYAGVNFADVVYRGGTVSRWLPFTPGLEVSGHIGRLAQGSAVWSQDSPS
jgi:NADPH2:quinone reductase